MNHSIFVKLSCQAPYVLVISPQLRRQLPDALILFRLSLGIEKSVENCKLLTSGPFVLF